RGENPFLVTPTHSCLGKSLQQIDGFFSKRAGFLVHFLRSRKGDFTTLQCRQELPRRVVSGTKSQGDMV
ncbi:hypothetical protein FA13DRAFT_1732073, partial [Coprinellus micaceus]